MEKDLLILVNHQTVGLQSQCISKQNVQLYNLAAF